MKIISGEAIQDLCGVSISKQEHKPFESSNQIDSIDIDNFDFENFDNPYKVYVNSSLINRVKPKLIESKLYEKLSKFQNPFDLILHNSDDSFNDAHLNFFNLPKVKRIFSQNVNTTNSKLIPLPIGLANSFWKWGDKEYFKTELKELIPKTKFIHFNFTVYDGGVRDEYRPQCYEAAISKGLETTPSFEFKEYVKELKKYKYSLSPEGNGIDCYRMWECLYLKVIPICHRNILTEYFSKIFPIVLVDDWNDLDINYLEENYEKLSNWKNYYLLDLDLYLKHINFYD
jgi:hypothetical protein